VPDSPIQQIVCCMGQPVAGNPTQFMMERAFAAAGLDWRYLTLEVPPEKLADAVKGLRVVLADAIEHLRPDGERKLTAPEWLLYNILEMKFLRGHKVREVAMRLAVSESDLYRKQRIAIENLAEIIALMEEEVYNGQSALPNAMSNGHSHS